MEIKKNEAEKESLISRIQSNYKEREGLHLTDLLYPRKYYMRIHHPKPLTEKEILYFIAGQGHEGALLKSLGISHGITFEWKGIYFSPDILEDKYVCEIKTRRRMLAKEGEEETIYMDYIKQLKGYVVALREKAKKDKEFFKWKDIVSGKLIVLSLVEKTENDEGFYARTEPKLVIYDIAFSEVDLDIYAEELLGMKDLITQAIDSHNISLLPLCPPWMCGTIRKTKLSDAFCKTCNKKFTSNQPLVSHAEKEHIIQPATYSQSLIPLCKWFQECKPPIILTIEETKK